MNKDIKYIIEDYFENQLTENTTNEDIIYSYLKENNFRRNFRITLPNIDDETTVENCAPYLIENEIYKQFKNISETNKDIQISPQFNSKSDKTNEKRYNESPIKLIGIEKPACDFIIKIKDITYPIEVKSIHRGDTDNLKISDNQNIQSYRYMYIIVSYKVRESSIDALNIQCIDGNNFQKNSTKIETQAKNIVKKVNDHKIQKEDKEK